MAILASLLLLSACGGDDADEVSTQDTTGSTLPRVTAQSVPDDTTRPVGPVTVTEAASYADGTEVTVLGYVFEPDEGSTVMCDVFGESFPPTCTGPQLVTDGLDINRLPGVETSSPGDLVAPATWTSAPVEVTGTLAAGALQVSG